MCGLLVSSCAKHLRKCCFNYCPYAVQLCCFGVGSILDNTQQGFGISSGQRRTSYVFPKSLGNTSTIRHLPGSFSNLILSWLNPYNPWSAFELSESKSQLDAVPCGSSEEDDTRVLDCFASEDRDLERVLLQTFRECRQGFSTEEDGFINSKGDLQLACGCP